MRILIAKRCDGFGTPLPTFKIPNRIVRRAYKKASQDMSYYYGAADWDHLGSTDHHFYRSFADNLAKILKPKP